MATYTINTGSVCLVRVDYADAAGGYAGWFLLNVTGDALSADPDGNPANGPGNYSALSNPTQYGSTNNPYTGVISGDTLKYRGRFLELVHARLERMFGVGHSATWTATIIQGVTPAVIDDNW